MARSLSTAEVARILGLGEARVRHLVRSGLCRPVRGPGGAYAFSFQDVVLLRASQSLIAQDIPPRRVKRVLDALEKELPKGRNLAALRLTADGRRVTARQGKREWEPETGQTVLGFGLDDLARKVATLDRGPGRRAKEDRQAEAADLFVLAVSQEEHDPLGAIATYREAIARDRTHADAHVNLGRLLHQVGRPAEALGVYREAVRLAPEDPVAHFNLALALEDTEGPRAAEAEYERALAADPEFADAHWNLAGLYEETGRPREALRHYAAYRRLTS